MPRPCSFRGHCYEHIPFVLTEYPHVACVSWATLKAITETLVSEQASLSVPPLHKGGGGGGVTVFGVSANTP